MLQLCQVFPNLVMYMVYTMVFSVYCKCPCLGLLQWIYWWVLLLFSFTTCTCGFMILLHLFVLSGFDNFFLCGCYLILLRPPVYCTVLLLFWCIVYSQHSLLLAINQKVLWILEYFGPLGYCLILVCVYVEFFIDTEQMPLVCSGMILVCVTYFHICMLFSDIFVNIVHGYKHK